MKHKIEGFTLVELMITLVIVGILAAVAYPSYVDYIKSTAESQVRGELIDLAAAQERWRAQNFQYTSSLANLNSALANNDKYSPTLTVSTNGQRFVAIATPKSGSVVEGEVSFKIDQDGTTCFGTAADGCTLGTDPVWGKR